ncbi:MAG TPA: SPFH domain-containing protein [Pyrinomonadaceae bacterium]|nr:SPFH domain-containing protein [Pyrinomonadaceae bacterium]
MGFLLVLIFLLIATLVVAAKTLVVAKEDERLVVFRLGKLLRVYGPGLSIIIPFTDRVVRVKVETIAGWRELSESELQQKAAQIASGTNH